MLAILEQMLVDEGEKLTRFERVLLEEALLLVFEKLRLSDNPQPPTITDLKNHCEKSNEESLRKISKLLFPWVGNTPYGKLLDRQGKISTDKPIVAFDLKGLSQYPDLQAVMILILTNFILDQVENDRTKTKRVLLDEAWQFLKSPAASSFMEYAARTFRKTGSGITFITQGIEEIIGSGIGPAIINNTATKLVMLQKGSTKILSDSLKLNTQELRLIQNLEQQKGVYSDGFLITGESRQVVRIKPTPMEYWISTSDVKDNQFIQDFLNEGHSLEEALFLAVEKAPFGVARLKGGAL
jgi:type IV secretory pathway VirB4 component